MFLADLIFVAHLLFILFIVVAPFMDNPLIHILHVTAVITLLVHWFLSSDVCCLSLLESKLRNIEYTDSFINKIVSPVYQMNGSTEIYIGVILLGLISIKKIHDSEELRLIFNRITNRLH